MIKAISNSKSTALLGPKIGDSSQEYFKAIDTKVLKSPLVHVDFKEYKNGQYKTIAIFSKLARGLMTRHIVETNAQTVDDLKTFNARPFQMMNG